MNTETGEPKFKSEWSRKYNEKCPQCDCDMVSVKYFYAAEQLRCWRCGHRWMEDCRG